MDGYWNGRKVVYTVRVTKPTIEPIQKPGAIQVTRRKRVSTSGIVTGFERRVIEGRDVLALQYSEKREQTKNLKRMFSFNLGARPKPGKDGSIRKASEKLAIAAWKGIRVMGKPGRGDRYQQTAHMDFLDLEMSTRREFARQRLSQVKIG